MARITAIRALVKKEAIQIVREPSSLITAFVLPLILLFLFGNGFSLDMESIKVGVLLQDSSPLADSLVQSLSESPYLDVYVSRNRKELEELLASSHIRAYAVVPLTFSKDFYSEDRHAQIQVLGDGSEPNTAQFAYRYINGIVQTWQQQHAQTPPRLSMDARVWYNEELLAYWFIIPGSIVVIMTVIGALLTALVLAREWEQGTMESVMSTPATMFEIIVSKFITYLILGIGSLTVCVLVACVLYKIPLRGSIFGLVTSSLAYLIFALQMGLLISSVTRNQ
ncbi:MAG: ABC transporter permease, partial [Chlamydiia bacterium]|nr:ABC transporter permease [Chlamydiia bacterium]